MLCYISLFFLFCACAHQGYLLCDLIRDAPETDDDDGYMFLFLFIHIFFLSLFTRRQRQ